MILPRKLRIWWRAFRYHFTPASIFPVCIGAVVSWSRENLFSLWYFFLLLSVIVLNHIALNMTDDYFDYRHAVDQQKPDEKNPYAGGSGTLTEGLIAPKNMFTVFVLLYIITIIIGLFLTFERGLYILIFWTIGIFSSIFYTAPPIKFSHHGFGELGLLLNFGPVLGMVSFFVQAQTISLEAFVATLPCGIMLFSMIVINEIPDITDDSKAGKLTLVARFGVRTGIMIYISSWVATFVSISIGILFSITPWYHIITFLGLPLALQSIVLVKKHATNPQQLPHANLAMIRAHSIICMCIMGSYIMYGLLHNRPLTDIIGYIVLFLVVYLPAAFSIFKKTQTEPI
jgi:1,4-dihydroxy-2-naphthoate octaprenyltransferase